MNTSESVRRILRLPSINHFFFFFGFPGGPDGKESACNAGDTGLIPGSESSIPG